MNNPSDFVTTEAAALANMATEYAVDRQASKHYKISIRSQQKMRYRFPLFRAENAVPLMVVGLRASGQESFLMNIYLHEIAQQSKAVV